MNGVDLEIFATSRPLPFSFPAPEVFSGRLMHLQSTDIGGIVCGLVALIAAGLWLRPKIRRALWVPGMLTLSSVVSVLCSLKVSVGCDELYLNLKHSFVFAQTSHFSFNSQAMVEGTVDFLPYLAAGILGKMSFPLVESILVITLLGNVLVIVSSWWIARRLLQDDQRAMFIAAAIGLLPGLCFVGATGFTATLFTGWFMLAMYFLFFAEPRRPVAGWFLMATITLVRTEGIALAFLVWAYVFLWEWRGARRALLAGVLISLPFFASCLVRKIAFGFALPAPIPFKFTNGDLYYLYRGARQFTATAMAHELHFYALLAAYPLVIGLRRRWIPREVLVVLAVSLLHTLLYFTGRGDWFPLVWGRYLMVLIIPVVLFSWIAILLFLRDRWPGSAKIVMAVAVLWSLPYVIFPERYSAYTQFVSDTRRRLDPWLFWRGVNQQGYFGRFLGMTLPPQAVICSSEVASVMYYAQRDLLDLLGPANPDIAYSPLNPLMPGDVAHRKRNPATIDKHRPDVICFWGMVRLVKENSRTTMPTIQQTWNAMSTTYLKPAYAQYCPLDIAQYRAGSLEHLQKLGYRWIVVNTPRATFNYLVSDSAYAPHLAAMKTLGIEKIGTARMDYTIHPDIAASFP